MKTFKEYVENRSLQEMMAAPNAAPAQDAYQQSAPYVRSFDNNETGKELTQTIRKGSNGAEQSAENLMGAMRDVAHRLFQLKNLQQQQDGKLSQEQQKEMAKVQDMLSQLQDMHYKATLKQNSQTTQNLGVKQQTNSLGMPVRSTADILRGSLR